MDGEERGDGNVCEMVSHQRSTYGSIHTCLLQVARRRNGRHVHLLLSKLFALSARRGLLLGLLRRGAGGAGLRGAGPTRVVGRARGARVAALLRAAREEVVRCGEGAQRAGADDG